VAVFAGGFDLPAVEAVGSGIGTAELEVLDLLALLVDKSLVLTGEHDADVLYRLLEPVRQYAEEHLAATPAEQDMTEGRHAECFLALAEGAAPKQFGPEQAAWFDRLEREYDNFRSVLAGSQADPSRSDQGLRLAAALGWFWIHRGRSSPLAGRLRPRHGAARGSGGVKPRARRPVAARLLARDARGSPAHSRRDQRRGCVLSGEPGTVP
jgi:predicted ATPase